jgi:hypothetical protein
MDGPLLEPGAVYRSDREKRTFGLGIPIPGLAGLHRRR